MAKAGKQSKVLKYGAYFKRGQKGISEDEFNLGVEFAMIAAGGKFKHGDRWCGHGLGYHVKEAMKRLWPDMYWHRWGDMLVEEFCRGGRLAVFGPSSSGKSYYLSRAAQTIFYANTPNPDEEQSGVTCIISSTTLPGLHRRIWDYIVAGHVSAKKRYPWLIGSMIESKTMLLADESDKDGRSYKNGIIGVACKRGGKWEGLEEYVGIKNKIFILLADECFPAGTLVDTPSGPRRIETIMPGDVVMNACGTGVVMGFSVSHADVLVQITTRTGRVIRCTRNHPFFTQKGWVKACDLNQTHYMLSQHECLRVLRWREKTKTEAFLQSELLREMDAYTAYYHKEKVGSNFQEAHGSAREESKVGTGIIGEDEREESHDDFRECCEGSKDPEGDGAQAEDQRREWDWTNGDRENPHGIFSERELELPNQNQDAIRFGLSDLLQSGLGVAGNKIGSRSGREFPQPDREEGSGLEEGDFLAGDWVDSVTLQKQEDSGSSRSGSGGTLVYNLQVRGHPSYSVNGFLVHNCHFMPVGFLDALANLESNGTVFTAMMGNLPDVDNPLGMAAEPKIGWDALTDVDVSRVFETRWHNGRCIQLIGTDSPNLDYPDEQEHYPKLISRDYIEKCAHNYGRESDKFNMFAAGKVPRSSMNRTVFTRAMCYKFNATHDVKWGHEPVVRGYGLDAAYSGVGGDRTVGFPFIFGKDTTGRWKIWLGTMKVYPGSTMKDVSHSEAIALECKRECEERGIDPSHVFFDGTGRSELTSAFARLWSPSVVPIEFGGPATDRPSFTGEKFLDGDEAGNIKTCRDQFDRHVTELWFAVRTAIQFEQMRGLPEDAILEGSQRKWEIVRGAKYCIETKDDMKERGLRSPDICDAIVCALEGARRLGFPLGKTPEVVKRRTNAWLDHMREEEWSTMRAEELV